MCRETTRTGQDRTGKWRSCHGLRDEIAFRSSRGYILTDVQAHLVWNEKRPSAHFATESPQARTEAPPCFPLLRPADSHQLVTKVTRRAYPCSPLFSVLRVLCGGPTIENARTLWGYSDGNDPRNSQEGRGGHSGCVRHIRNPAAAHSRAGFRSLWSNL
ncbi:hypothetical protein VTK73DRAFT_1063 [Phialemonium thermophilum]|uniref:Uncharacterized protein n=1 Tax=Phialemonium thermophilum TaxID=223376 RepID=A0ABR3VTZ8_9PEZI